LKGDMMSLGRFRALMCVGGMRRWRLTGIALTGCFGLGLLGAGSALAETKTFT